MLYTANANFAGIITMSEGETRELTAEQAKMLAPFVDPVEDGAEVMPVDDVGNKPARRKTKAKN